MYGGRYRSACSAYSAATVPDLPGEVRRTYGRPYDPDSCIQPQTLAEMIVWVLNAPADAYASELSVLRSPS